MIEFNIFCIKQGKSANFRKPTRLFFDKVGCTRQFESELSLRSFAQFHPITEASTSPLGLLQLSLRPFVSPS